ncbi:PTS glucose transporter subunit IIA [Cryobacterium cheniae]|uniref:PTS glucose transporter subunit IIA n=1 Tax=Cryobacterium cheniae TaxID=1259262 RepID=A0A4R8XZT6_9MICO|nr:PTS glucose transporter subunit IIA [Cryobacterium cheniae]TFC83514.1 PTS glucose transporter subunit IIA [Cryobacterium cheniae]
MPENILSPLRGTVLSLGDVPDPVFAQEIVGGGVAVQPSPDTGLVTARAPVTGTLVRIQPHAFVIQSALGTGILVHLGIDTVHMDGEGFEVLAAEGSVVQAGDPVVRYDPQVIAAHGYADICLVIILQSPPGAVPAPTTTTTVDAAELLFSWPS